MTADLPQFSTIHSHPSSLDSGSEPKDFAKQAKAMGSVSLTCTDHGTLEASNEIYRLAKANNLIACIGLEGYFRADSCPILTKLGIPKTDTVPRGSDRDEWVARYPQGTFFDYNKYYHLTLGFLDYKAYLCAVRLLSKADARAEQHGSERKPLFDWAEIEELAAHNVTASSSCLVGMVSRHLVGANNTAAAKAYLERLHHLFGDRFYVEVFPHACTHDFVKKVFVDTGLHKPLQFTWTKKLRTEAGEFSAEQLADGFKPDFHGKLLAVKHYHTWTPVEEPLPIRSVKKTEGFIENEPRAWAQDSDMQKACNRFVLAAARKYNIPVLIGDDCLAQGTLIRCLSGYKPVEDVRPGDLVVAHNGQTQKVEATRGFFTKKKCVQICAGGDPVTLTVDHRVWAQEGIRHSNGVYPLGKHKNNEGLWKNAGDLKPGDLIFVPKSNCQGTKEVVRIDLSAFVTHKYRSEVSDDSVVIYSNITKETTTSKRWLNIDSKLAWVLGFFVGDGNAHNNLSSFVAEIEMYQTLRSKLVQLVSEMGFSFDEIHKKKHSVFRVISTTFTQFLRREFYTPNKVKKIPNWIEETSSTWRASFCSGMFHSDGSGSGDRYSLSMTSLTAIGWVREEALMRGVYCSLGSRLTTGATKKLYTVNLPHEAKEIFSLWGKAKIRKAIRWIETPTGFWIRVKRVKLIDNTLSSTPVYDLQVSGEASFSTSAFAVHNSHLATPDDKIVQDVRLSQSGPWKFHTSYHLMSSAEAFSHFERTLGTSETEFRGWIDNSLAWAERFKGFKFESKPSLPTKFFPDDTMGYLKGLIAHHGRMRMERPYLDRLKSEIDILQRNGVIKLLPYFFPDEEVCRLYNDGLGWLTGPGRGSAAGLYLSYLMGITHVDPLRYGLSLERFITPDRIASGALPDIDQDLPNRDPLEGFETDVVEFQAADGTTHIVPEIMRVPTDQGLMTIREAAAAGAEVTPWWKEKKLADPDSPQQ